MRKNKSPGIDIFQRIGTSLNDIKYLIKKKYLKPETFIQISRFAITGALAGGVDFGVYILLFKPAGIVFSKAASFITATLFSYMFNKFWTFKQKRFSFPEGLRFVLLYTVSMLLNNIVNKTVFSISSGKFAGFIFATGFCAVFNFLGLKIFVFRKRNDPAGQL